MSEPSMSEADCDRMERAAIAVEAMTEECNRVATENRALAAELADLRQHLGTLTPGGSHTCITCAAHCVVIGDLEARVKELEAQDEIHWKTRRTLLAERDALAARCQEINDKWSLENQALAADKADLVRVLGVADARIRELEAALNDLLPGLILDRRYADADDDIDAMNSRIETVTSALGAQSETSVEPIKGGELTPVRRRGFL